mgnify:CR=1 FL=1
MNALGVRCEAGWLLLSVEVTDKKSGGVMAVVDLLTGELLSMGLEWIVKKGVQILDGSKSLIVEETELGGIPPEAVATPSSPVGLLTGDEYTDSSPFLYLESNCESGWVGEMRLRIWLNNISSHVVEIIGITPNKKQICVDSRMAAVLFPAQRDLTGNLCRLRCDLDSDQPFMQQFEQKGGWRIPISERYMFSEDYIRIEPHVRVCISIIFTTTKGSYEVNPSLLVRENKQIACISVPLKRRAFIYPFTKIDRDSCYRRSYFLEPPYIIKDSSESIQNGFHRFVADR